MKNKRKIRMIIRFSYTTRKTATLNRTHKGLHQCFLLDTSSAKWRAENDTF